MTRGRPEGGRFFEYFAVGDVYRCRHGRTVTEANHTWFILPAHRCGGHVPQPQRRRDPAGGRHSGRAGRRVGGGVRHRVVESLIAVHGAPIDDEETISILVEAS